MNAWKTIVLAGACLAFAAPAANASYDGLLPAKAKHAKVVKAAKKSHHSSAVAKKKGNGSGRVIVINIQAPANPQPVPDDPNLDCMTTGDNCTPDVACATWGIECDQVVPTQPTDAATDPQNPTG